MASSPTIQPCGYRILVEPDSGEKTSEGGIVLPGTSRMEQDTGIVVAVGPHAWQDFDGEPWAKVGDRIMFAKYGGKFVTDPETHKEYKILNDEDVNCVIKSDVISDNRLDQ